MARQPRRQGESSIYHVVSRGVGRCVIFEDSADRRRFLDELEARLKEGGAQLHAWCLMDNHYHLLIHQELSALSQTMKGLNSSYALYFNGRHNRVGHLFQGRFKSEAVDTNEYLLTVVRYIHQNPVRAGMAKTCDYRWSSYGEYLGLPGITHTELVLGMFGSLDEFERFHAALDIAAACCDVGRSRRLVDDGDVRSVANSVLGDVSLASVAGLGRSERDDAIRRLRAAHLSVRQIERLTGVSRAVVGRIGV